jgi:hypothetical protein
MVGDQVSGVECQVSGVGYQGSKIWTKTLNIILFTVGQLQVVRSQLESNGLHTTNIMIFFV